MSKQTKPNSGHVKVMVSMTADEVRRIDARADAAHMNRSAFIVEMTLREEVALVSAVETLHRELGRFAVDNAGWKGKHSEKAEAKKVWMAALDWYQQETDEFSQDRLNRAEKAFEKCWSKS